MDHKNIHSICGLLFLCFLTACSISPGNQKEGAKIDIYFDLAGLMQQQIDHLSSTSPKVRKNTIVDGQEEEREFDSLNWQKELNIFAKADINKPRLLSQYQTTTYTDNAGNKVTQHQNIEENVSGVIKMEIVENPATRKVLDFCFFPSFNTLFTSEVELEMNFNENKGEPKLTSYSITGFEKVILRDTMRYSIQAKVEPEI